MYVVNHFEAARQKYRPDIINCLFVAEAPPELRSERFFYFENVQTQDSLFLEMMKILYPDDTTDTKYIRRNKAAFLERFRRDGFYLIDSVDEPISQRSQKRNMIRKAIPTLKNKRESLTELSTKVILISAPVYDICAEALKTKEINVVNHEMIDFPGSGRQKEFHRKLGHLLRLHGYELSR